MKTAVEHYEQHKRSIRSPIFAWASDPEGDVNTNEIFAEIERNIIAAIEAAMEAAVARERARCLAILNEGVSIVKLRAIERGDEP